MTNNTTRNETHEEPAGYLDSDIQLDHIDLRVWSSLEKEQSRNKYGGIEAKVEL